MCRRSICPREEYQSAGITRANTKAKKGVIVVGLALVIAARWNFETVRYVATGRADRCQHALPLVR
jgi:hypothetical protein